MRFKLELKMNARTAAREHHADKTRVMHLSGCILLHLKRMPRWHVAHDQASDSYALPSPARIRNSPTSNNALAVMSSLWRPYVPATQSQRGAGAARRVGPPLHITGTAGHVGLPKGLLSAVILSATTYVQVQAINGIVWCRALGHSHTPGIPRRRKRDVGLTTTLCWSNLAHDIPLRSQQPLCFRSIPCLVPIFPPHGLICDAGTVLWRVCAQSLNHFTVAGGACSYGTPIRANTSSAMLSGTNPGIVFFQRASSRMRLDDRCVLLSAAIRKMVSMPVSRLQGVRDTNPRSSGTSGGGCCCGSAPVTSV